MDKLDPLVLIPARRIKDPEFGIPVHGNCDSYSESIVSAGGIPILVPLVPMPEASLVRLVGMAHGVLFTGGEDVAPHEYGENPHPRLGSVCELRDSQERMIFAEAMKQKKPVLGICRGLQAINVFLGGSLIQDIPSDVPHATTHEIEEECWHRTPHHIDIVSGSMLSEIFSTPRISVNSIHHQAIKQLAPELTVSARAPEDGIIEAVESREKKIVAVQWHPETMWQQDPGQEMLELFRWFVESLR